MSRDKSPVFRRLVRLAALDGGLETKTRASVWRATIDARDRDADWHVAINPDLRGQVEIQDYPLPGKKTRILGGRALIYLGELPAGATGPRGGYFVKLENLDVQEDAAREKGDLVDELLRDLEAELRDQGADLDQNLFDELETPISANKLLGWSDHV